MDNFVENSTRRSIVRLCIDGIENSDFYGRLESPLLGSQPFHGVVHMTSCLEDFYNEIKFPQSFFQLRSFSEEPSKRERRKQSTKPRGPNAPRKPVEGYTEEAGILATFNLHVLFRHNATWQGSIRWLERDCAQKFSSELEVLRLIRGALCMKQTPSALK